MPVVQSLKCFRISLLGSLDGLGFFGVERLSLPFFLCFWLWFWRLALRSVLLSVLYVALLSAL
jgi:hypothetical protein